MPAISAPPLDPREQSVLRQVTRLNTYVFAATAGLLGAATVATATLALALRGTASGEIPPLLSMLLWSYRLDAAGGLVGSVWGFMYGSVFGALAYRGYAATLGGRLPYHAPSQDRRKTFRVPVLRLHGHRLGLVVGTMAAAHLLVFSHWAMLDGDPARLAEAQLIAQYLAGYAPATFGCLIGAVQLFAVAFLAARALAGLYNRIVDWRQSRIPRRA